MSRRHLVIVAVVGLLSTAQAETIYVDADCAGPGEGSEADPYCSIQTAIENAAIVGDEIVVAHGTYFEVINFFGKAIWLHSADGPEVTIIDGQQLDCVVTCANSEGSNTVLEGFTITNGLGLGGGMANDGGGPTVINCTFSGNEASDGYGGGMRNMGSSPTVTRCTFSGNSADYGGGMYNWESSPTVTNCTFSGNSAFNYAGGGMCNEASSPTVTDCTFEGNEANGGTGGGMYNELGSPTVTNCTFEGNEADVGAGGGMCNVLSSPTVTNCAFNGNAARGTGNGGGMYNWWDSPTVTDCTFEGNEAGGGGGMSNWNSSLTVTNCTFEGNEASGGGGGMFNIWDNSPTVANCTFSGNRANRGSGMYNRDSRPTVANCTFSGNTAGNDGGGMYSWNSSPTLTNCILWGDSPGEIFDYLDSSTAALFSDVEGGWPGTGNIDADPLFIDPDNGDLHLLPGSPCVDAGDNTAVPEGILKDLDGNRRFVVGTTSVQLTAGPIVDMGAYEYQPDSSVEILLRIILGSEATKVGTHFGPCP